MTESRARLSPRVSAGLDVARTLAACYVVFHHVANARGWSHGLGLILRFGQEAVLVFFLLSGFVIFANERKRALNPRGYFWRRFRRLYPALLVAMLTSTIVALADGDFTAKFNWPELLGTLAYLQDISFLKPGVIVDPYLGNDPLWSLSYEMAFYLAFPFVLRIWVNNPRRTDMIIGAVCCVSYIVFVAWPNHFSLITAYFLIWWCGAMAADTYLRGASDFRAFLPSLGWLALLCVIAAAAVKILGFKGLGFYPFLPLRHFAVGLVMLIALSNRFGAALASLCLPVAQPAAAVASITYGLYVLHFPLLVSWNRSHTFQGLALGVAVLIPAAYLADRGLNKWLPRAPRN